MKQLRLCMLGAVTATVLAVAPAAMANPTNCPSGWACAFANAGFSPANWETNEMHFQGTNYNYGAYPNPGNSCSNGGNWNDCISSQDNERSSAVYYYVNWYCGARSPGHAYKADAKTWAEYIGSYWNDEFSSDAAGTEVTYCSQGL